MGDNKNETYIDNIQILTSDHLGELRTYFKRNFILHSSNHLPIWTTNQFRLTDTDFGQQNSFVVRITKIQFIKLPPPYDNKCTDYTERQQFECMDKCIEKYYNNQFKCFPNNNNYHTILVDDDIFKKNFVFCHQSDYISKKNELFVSTCYSLCGNPCSKIDFIEEIIPSNMLAKANQDPRRHIQFIIDNVDYLKITWLPKLTIISLFIKIFNIWSLWHGIHFKLIIDFIFKYVNKVYSYIFRKIVINIDWKNYINFEMTKVKN